MKKIKSLILLAAALIAVTFGGMAQEAPNFINEPQPTPKQAAWQPPAAVAKIIGNRPAQDGAKIMQTLRHFGVKPGMDAETAKLYTEAAARELLVNVPGLNDNQVQRLLRLTPDQLKK